MQATQNQADQQNDAQDDVKPTDAKPTDAKQTDAKPSDPGNSDDGIKDSHGQPGINLERHNKEVSALNDRIKELEGQLSEAAANKKAIQELKASQEEERTTYKLELAGCKNVKAAKAILADYEGDVSKLAADCPYLFSTARQTGSTGIRNEGAARGIDEKIDRAFGIKK